MSSSWQDPLCCLIKYRLGEYTYRQKEGAFFVKIACNLNNETSSAHLFPILSLVKS